MSAGPRADTAAIRRRRLVLGVLATAVACGGAAPIPRDGDRSLVRRRTVVEVSPPLLGARQPRGRSIRAAVAQAGFVDEFVPASLHQVADVGAGSVGDDVGSDDLRNPWVEAPGASSAHPMEPSLESEDTAAGRDSAASAATASLKAWLRQRAGDANGGDIVLSIILLVLLAWGVTLCFRRGREHDRRGTDFVGGMFSMPSMTNAASIGSVVRSARNTNAAAAKFKTKGRQTYRTTMASASLGLHRGPSDSDSQNERRSSDIGRGDTARRSGGGGGGFQVGQTYTYPAHDRRSSTQQQYALSTLYSEGSEATATSAQASVPTSEVTARASGVHADDEVGASGSHADDEAPPLGLAGVGSSSSGFGSNGK